jgi:hypothetical protein
MNIILMFGIVNLDLNQITINILATSWTLISLVAASACIKAIWKDKERSFFFTNAELYTIINMKIAIIFAIFIFITGGGSVETFD